MFIHHSGKANCGRDSTNMSKARVGPERGRHGPNMSSSCMELAFRKLFNGTQFKFKEHLSSKKFKLGLF